MDGNGNGHGHGHGHGNSNRQLDAHYLNSGFPYAVTDNFMDFFDGVPHQPTHYAHSGPIHDQENAYWLMNMSSYKYGVPAHGSIPYYDPYEVHNYLPRMDLSRSAWEYPVMMNVTEPASVDVQSAETTAPNMQVIPEECSSPNDDSASSSQAVWQDEIDPDNMTYEELLDLGEAIGTESRGLSEDLINSLPTTRYKSGGFFLKRKSGERCVICQMRYKRGDKQINLPCKHVYHSECGSKWLGINKTCPICNVEVLAEESNQH